MSAPRFIVTGTRHSNLGRAAAILSSLGLPCGHEVVFAIEALVEGAVGWPEALPGDASWLAAPLLGNFPAETKILHQVRHPYSVIRALKRSRLFEQPSLLREYVRDFCDVGDGSPVEQCARYWIRWNETVESVTEATGNPVLRYPIEMFDAAHVERVLAFLDFDANDSNVAITVAGLLPNSSNHVEHLELDLPSGLRQEIECLAERYGYDLLANKVL